MKYEKTLTNIGNSKGIVINSAVIQVLGIDEHTKLILDFDPKTEVIKITKKSKK